MATSALALEVEVRLRSPSDPQRTIIKSTAKRKVIRAGRRLGKTVALATIAVINFLRGKRVLYATPTADQIETFWFEVKRALKDLIEAKKVLKNETRHTLEVPGTKVRIRAKTAWNADTLRGDYADVLLFDEWQLMDEDAWDLVGQPMLLDNNGDAIFSYTPPSRRTRSVSKARDKMHAAKLFKAVQSGNKGDGWQCFHFKSADNPRLSREALAALAVDMSSLAYRQEILAEDIDEVPGALWRREVIDTNRLSAPPQMDRIVVAIDPAATSTAKSDECGICVAGVAQCDCKGADKVEPHTFILEDLSGRYPPHDWARILVSAFDRWEADAILGEVNNGGEMVEEVLSSYLRSMGRSVWEVNFKSIHASRGKMLRAEPIATQDERGLIHHVREFEDMEEQMFSFTGSGEGHDDRVDARVYACSELSTGLVVGAGFIGGWV